VRALALAATAAVVWLPGCAALPATPEARELPTRAPRASTRATCPTAQLGRLPEGMEITDRELVAFGPARFGVETEAGETAEGADARAARSILMVSGGYEDDVAESYDNLEVVGTRRVAGHRATLLRGSLLETPVHLAVWRDAASAPPCDVHAVVAVNLTRPAFLNTLDAVHTREPNPRETSHG
jgi:hypothetical protein